LINHKTVFGTRYPAFWVGTVCALHEHTLHTLGKLNKKFKNTNKL